MVLAVVHFFLCASGVNGRNSGSKIKKVANAMSKNFKGTLGQGFDR